MPLWGEFGARFRRAIAIKRGEGDEIEQPSFGFRSLTGLTELAEALMQAGRAAEALALVDAGIDHSDGGWITPELLRLKGELLLSQGVTTVTEAEALFRQSFEEARRQEALSWELRAATSLSRLLRNQARDGDAIACLQPVYDRFTEGFETADLIAAKQLLK